MSVVRFSAAACGEERCVTTLKTAVEQTKQTFDGSAFVNFHCMQMNLVTSMRVIFGDD